MRGLRKQILSVVNLTIQSFQNLKSQNVTSKIPHSNTSILQKQQLQTQNFIIVAFPTAQCPRLILIDVI